MQTKFKVGDTVYAKESVGEKQVFMAKGVIKEINKDEKNNPVYGVAFTQNIGGTTLSRKDVRKGYGWWCEENQLRLAGDKHDN